MYYASKESHEAFMRLQDYGTEINWCMREQGFLYYDVYEEEKWDVLETFSKLMEEYGEK